MTPSEIQACLERANEVLNGFKRPSERNAKDVILILRHYAVAQDPKRDTKEPNRANKTPEMPDFMKDLFGFK